MAEPVGDLVVDLSLDAARFDEQMARVRRHFSGTESDAKKAAKRTAKRNGRMLKEVIPQTANKTIFLKEYFVVPA